MHKFPTCTLGKISLSYKRSYDGKLMAAMLNVIEVLLSKICVSPAMYFMKYSIKKKALTAHIIFLVPQCSLTSLLTVFVWWFFSHPAAEIREEIILSEPAPPTPSPVPFSPAKSVTSVEVPSAPSPISNQSPEYGGIAATTGRWAYGSWICLKMGFALSHLKLSQHNVLAFKG